MFELALKQILGKRRHRCRDGVLLSRASWKKQIPADRLRHLRSKLISNADGFSDEHVAVPSGWLDLRGA